MLGTLRPRFAPMGNPAFLAGLTVTGIIGLLFSGGFLDPLIQKTEETLKPIVQGLLIRIAWWFSLIWTVYRYLPAHINPLFLLICLSIFRFYPSIKEHFESKEKVQILLAEPVLTEDLKDYEIVETYPRPQVPLLPVLKLEPAESSWSNPSSPSPISEESPLATPNDEEWVLLP